MSMKTTGLKCESRISPHWKLTVFRRTIARAVHHGWPVCECVGCDKRQRRHTMTVFRCACALLVTPYSLPMINNWPAVQLSAISLQLSLTSLRELSFAGRRLCSSRQRQRILQGTSSGRILAGRRLSVSMRPDRRWQASGRGVGRRSVACHCGLDQ